VLAVVDFDGVPAIIVTVFSAERHPAYDPTGDVLHLTAAGDDKEAEVQQTPEGHAVRLDPDGRTTHVTAIDARRLLNRDGELMLGAQPRDVARESERAHRSHQHRLPGGSGRQGSCWDAHRDLRRLRS